MAHFHIDIIVTDEEVKIIKEQFQPYVEEAGGFTIRIQPDNEANPSPELEAVINNMFINLMMTINYGKFQGVH